MLIVFQFEGFCMLELDLRLQHWPMPQDRQSFLDLDAPIARLAVEGEMCIPLGKVFSWSPLHYDIVVMSGDRTTRIKRLKTRIHIEPCRSCPENIVW